MNFAALCEKLCGLCGKEIFNRKERKEDAKSRKGFIFSDTLRLLSSIRIDLREF